MTNQLLDAALAYAAKGWPIFPVSATKEPLVEGGVLSATTDPATIRQWWERHPRANIALDAGGAGFMVFDFDPGSDKAAFARSIGLPSAAGIPATGLRATTPRGGDHWYYQLGDGETVPPYTASNVKGEPKFSPHVDVRSFHSYVLLPPSRTADGVYEWASYGKPAHRTDEMYRVAHVARAKSEQRDEWIIRADLPENIAAAVEWLKTKAKPAIKGSGGNITAYATAAMCKSYGLSAPMAFEVMWGHWAPRCTPAWYSPESLETVIEHAYEYNTSPPGNMTPAYREAKTRELFKPVAPAEGEPLPPYEGRFQVSSVLDLEARPAPKWLLDEVIPERGYSILYGPPGAFKTFLALDMALSIAHWQPWHGRAVNNGRVLYCLGEGAFDVDKRIRAWLAHHECALDTEAFKVIEPAPLIRLGADRADFIKAAQHYGPWDLVVVDTVGRVMAGIDDNGALGARMFTDFATEIRLHLGAATLAITHAPKDRPEVLLGSGAYEADADTIYNATVVTKGDAINVRQHKIKYGAPWEKPLGFRKRSAANSMVLEPCAPGRTVRDKEATVSRNYEAQFLVALAKRGEATWPDIKADLCGMNEIATPDRDKFKGELDNWFKRWGRRTEFDTGRRSGSNSIILETPK